MQNVADLFALWPADADLGRDIHMPYSTVAAWKQRGSIPVAHWANLLRAARRRGLAQVTAESLVALHDSQGVDPPTGLGEQDAAGYQSERETAKNSYGERADASLGDGHFSRFKHLRRSHFQTLEAINEHVAALREEWDRR